MTDLTTGSHPFKVLIVGAGVAGLEAALALHELAGELVQTTVLAPNTEFVYRAMSVREPFGRASANRFALSALLAQAGAVHKRDTLKWLDHEARLVHTSGGETLPYDGLLLAVGALAYTRYPQAITIDPTRLDEQLHGVIQDIEVGTVKSMAFIVPAGRYWPLPAYELAMMTASRAHEMGQTPRITLLTPEQAPLAAFGETASAAVAELLAEHRVDIITSAAAQVRVAGRITLRGRAGELLADRVVALPELRGPSVPGLPATAIHGFIATNPHGRVRHLKRVFAAGDITDYPVKQGAIAAQQGACVAQELAGMAGVATVAEPFEPIIHGVLLGARRPLYLRARLVGGWPASSEVSDKPLWEPADKIHAPYLTRAIARLGHPGPSLTTLAPV